jgi:hypothetical protein
MNFIRSVTSPFLVSTSLFFVAACSSGTDGTPAATGGQPSTTGGASGTATGGALGSGGAKASGGATSGGVSTGGVSTGGAGSGGAATGGLNAGGSITGGSGGVSNTSGSAGSTAAGAAQGGSGAGQGGSSTGGAGGASKGGNAGQAGAAAQGGGGGGAAAGTCPTGATFCSGFEDAALPTGAVYKSNGNPQDPWTTDFEVDSTTKHSGNSSLRVKSQGEGTGGAYKMLAVPTPGSAFWVRFYIRSDKDLGEIDHNVLTQAAANDSPNDGTHMEFGEDVGIALHLDDSNIRWPDGYGRLMSGTTKPYTLPKDTWHCVEISYDGAGKAYKVYVGNAELINAANFPSTTVTYSFFKFGYNALHGTVRKTWYDDVVVAAARVGCQ